MAAKKDKKWVHPYKDYKYRSGNEGRHHPGMVHPGYCDLALRAAHYPYFRPKDQTKKEAKAA